MLKALTLILTPAHSSKRRSGGDVSTAFRLAQYLCAPQKSLITADRETRTYQFNHEYYLLKPLSHFLQRGATPLHVHGTFDDALACLNPDRSIVVVLRNENAQEKAIDLTLGDRKIMASMPG